VEEHIADTLLTVSGVMHFFGQHRVADALVYCARLCRAERLFSFVDLVEHVEEREAVSNDRG
jgi:hypothetical protein